MYHVEEGMWLKVLTFCTEHDTYNIKEKLLKLTFHQGIGKHVLVGEPEIKKLEKSGRKVAEF